MSSQSLERDFCQALGIERSFRARVEEANGQSGIRVSEELMLL